jgi:hypothetical protein
MGNVGTHITAMALEVIPMSSPIERVMDGRSWAEFCDRLKAAGDIVLAPDTPATQIDRAEGWRYLSRLTRIGLEMMLEHADADFPAFYSASHATAKIGADNPDNIYLNATIAGDREYRLYGTRGTIASLTFGTKANRYAIDGTMASTGELHASELELDADGAFEIHVSRERRSRNWLPLAADTSMLIVRQTFLDRRHEIPAKVSIERLNGPARPAPLSAAALDQGLMSAAAFVTGTARTFVEWARLFRCNPNELATVDQTPFLRAGGDPNIFYLHGYWQLAEDEALVIHTPIPKCELWNFQLDNFWMESLDYRHLPIWINKSTARYNADGTVTIVVAARNPGVANFIDTAGHTVGTMLLRWVGAREHPVPQCRVVKLANINGL